MAKNIKWRAGAIIEIVPKKKQWIGWVAFEKKDKPLVTFDQYGNELVEVYKKRKEAYGFSDIRKVRIEEV